MFFEYEDISDEPDYRHLLNKEYTLKEDMLVQGINTGALADNKIDYYVLKPYSMRVGPEIVSDLVLSKGQVIKIVGVRRSINRSLLGKYKIQVMLSSSLNLNPPNLLVCDLDYVLQQSHWSNR